MSELQGDNRRSAARVLWAKGASGESTLVHPLICHLADVAAVAEQIVSDCLGRHTQRRLSDWLGVDTEEVGRWISFWAGCHDIGKACPGFQGRHEAISHSLRGFGLPFGTLKEAPPHGCVTVRAIEEEAGEAIAPRVVDPQLQRLVAQAVGSHHGEVIDQRTCRVPPRLMGGEPWRRVRCFMVSELANLLDLPEEMPAPPADLEERAAFGLFLAGLTSVADWLGSSERYFPFCPGPPAMAEYMTTARQRATAALQATGWLPRPSVAHTSAFADVFAHPPRSLQVVTEELGGYLRAPALVLIEAPTGEGKTEAGLHLSDSWSGRFDLRGLYVALPTQATSNQMVERVAEYAQRRLPALPAGVRLLHSKAAFREAEIGPVYDTAGTDQGRAVAERWFSARKRGLLAPYAVGTIDQALMSVLQSRHMFVRLFGLSGKCVILDEIHAYDAYMSSLIHRLLQWLRHLGCSVVLMSATLPEAQRRRLLESWTGRHAAADDVAYPRVTWADAEYRPGAMSVATSRGREIRINWCANDSAARRAEEAAEAGGAVAVIFNTVREAQDFFGELQALDQFRTPVALFHARFPFEQRKSIEESVLHRYGPGASGDRAGIVVATQVIEQSLDLDFDLMLTAVAPIDLLLQRAGRLHRHDRQRPEQLREPVLELIKPASQEELPYFGPSEFVYDRHLLLRSYLSLQDRTALREPDDVQELIESVYGPEPPPGTTEAWRQELARTREAMESKRQRYEYLAKQARIPAPNDWSDLRAMEAVLAEDDDPAIHPEVRAMTRFTDTPTVELVCLFSDGDQTYFDRDGQEMIDLDQQPDFATVERLIGRSLQISHRRVVTELLDQVPPAAWRRNSHLRHHRLAVFNPDGIMQMSSHVLRLDESLGLMIEPRGDRSGDEP